MPNFNLSLLFCFAEYSNTLIDTFHTSDVLGHHISLQHGFRQHKSYSNLHNDAIDFFVPKIIISI